MAMNDIYIKINKNEATLKNKDIFLQKTGITSL